MEEKIFSPDIVWLVKLTGISECSPDKSPFAPFAKPINYTNTLFKKPEQLGVPYKERLSNVTRHWPSDLRKPETVILRTKRAIPVCVDKMGHERNGKQNFPLAWPMLSLFFHNKNAANVPIPENISFYFGILAKKGPEMAVCPALLPAEQHTSCLSVLSLSFASGRKKKHEHES